MAASFLPLAIIVSLLATAGAASADDYSHTPAPAPVPKGDHKLLVWVEGLVYYQSYAHRDTWSLDGAATLPGAQVSVTCREPKNRIMVSRTPVADRNGYFPGEFEVSSAADYYMGDPAKACFVQLLSSPNRKCDELTYLNHGIVGTPLRHDGKRWSGEGSENVVYDAGPISFRQASYTPTCHY